jgi:hypothetical protein
MRRPRRRLEVSTFPFLAVLLCAMGSLILLLLVLDRRAKAVARAKAEEAATAARAEHEAESRAAAEAAAERKAERERRRLARQDELARAKGDLDGRLRAAEERKAGAARAASAQRKRWRDLLEVLGNQRQELARAEREAATERGKANEAEQMSESARKEAARLSAQLSGLELVLGELKAARKRDAHTYSLLPYRGRRGDGRRPLYVECTANGLMFHPDHSTLSRVASPAEIRAAVDARVEWLRKKVLSKGGRPDKRAYLLMLIRPDGIPSYYTAVAALQGREVDFGYEFIDADWVLDFPEDDSAAPTQPWMKAHHTPVAPSDPSAPTRKVAGLRSGRIGGGGEGGGAGDGFAGTRARPTATGNASIDLPPLPGASGTGGTSAGSDLPPLPGAGGPPGRTLGPGRSGIPAVASGGGIPDQDGALRGAVPPPQVARAAQGRPAGFVPGASGNPGAASGAGIPDQDGSLRGAPSPPPGVRVAHGQPAIAPGAPWVASGAPTGPPPTGTAPGGAGPAASATSSGLPPLPAPMTAGRTGAAGGGRPNPDGTLPGTPAPSPGGGTGSAQASVMPPVPGATLSAPTGSPPLYPSGGAAPPAPAGGGQPPDAAGRAGQVSAGQSGQGTAGQPQDPDEPQGPRLDAGVLHGREKPSPRPPRPMRLIGNRDWVIPVECRADGVVLRHLGQKLSLASLAGKAAGESPLLRAVKQMIDRRQAGVRPGEPPYRPQVRFLIYPDGLRTYFLAFPALEPLGIPQTRQNVEADPSPRSAP